MIKLLDALEAMQRAYAEGRLRPSELEAGHFAEIAFRIAEQETFGGHTPLGRALNRVDQLVQKLGSSGSGHDSFRLHIPRVLLGIYDVRNRRGVGHPSGEVDPNPADAELLVTSAGWVTAELLRHAQATDLAGAQRLVNRLASRHMPLIEEIDGTPIFLVPALSTRERVLLLLFHAKGPMKRAELALAVPSAGNGALRAVFTTLRRKSHAHETARGWVLTTLGTREAEGILERHLSSP